MGITKKDRVEITKQKNEIEALSKRIHSLAFVVDQQHSQIEELKAKLKDQQELELDIITLQSAVLKLQEEVKALKEVKALGEVK